MVARWPLAIAFALCLVSPLPAKELADYRIGDIAKEDIVAPAPLVVLDADATAALKQKEAERVPLIFRFYPGAADEVEMDFRASSSGSQSNAQLARLREAMSHPIRPDRSPVGFRVGNQIRLLTVTNRDETLTLESAERLGVDVPRENVLTLSRARADFLQSVPFEEPAFVGFAAALLKPNCVLDTELTRLSRAKHTEQVFTADHYEAGQIICRRGQVIDGKIMAALTQLKEMAAAARLPLQMDGQKSSTGRITAEAGQISERNHWLLAGLAGGSLILVGVWWRWARGRTHASLLPARIPPGEVAAVSADVPGDSWQQRALVAEQRTQRAHAALRAGLMPYLAHLLKTTLVRGLISQRSSLLDAQQAAVAEMAELERRLDELQAPLQERLRAYEKRIEELERALAVRDEENRELIKAKILLAKRQLDIQRAKNRVEFN